jgi:hypothetical protein
MGELAAVSGLVGAGTCLAERLTGPGRAGWGPASVVLVVMALMTCGAGGATLAAGAGAVAAAGVWTALTGPERSRAPAVVDLVTMALLTAQVGRLRPTGATGHPSGMRMSGGAGPYDARFFLFVVGCWLLARAGVRLTAVAGSGAGWATVPARAGCREEPATAARLGRRKRGTAAPAGCRAWVGHSGRVGRRDQLGHRDRVENPHGSPHRLGRRGWVGHRDRTGSPDRLGRRDPLGHRDALRHAGSAVMVVAMAAMLR